MTHDSGNPFDAARVAYEAGQADMLAKCIEAVRAVRPRLSWKDDYDVCVYRANVYEALRAQGEKPTPPPLPPSVGVPEKRGSLW